MGAAEHPSLATGIMSLYATPKILLAVSVFAAMPGFSARAAAVVGETRTVHVQAEQAPYLDHVKAGYRRPDTIPFPHRNPYTPQKARLGHMLYNDPRLSDTGTLSCASCHNPGFAYGDGLQK